MIRFDATGRRPVEKWTTRNRDFPTSPQAQQQQKRSIDLVHKPVNSVCYRHRTARPVTSSSRIPDRHRPLLSVIESEHGIGSPGAGIVTNGNRAAPRADRHDGIDGMSGKPRSGRTFLTFALDRFGGGTVTVGGTRERWQLVVV